MYTRSVDTFPNNQLVNTLFTIGQDVAFVKEFPTFDFDVPRNFLELRPVFRNSLFKDYDWHKVQGCFNANGGETYMVIGNFRNDANTETVSTGKRNPNFPNGLTSYYAIDNVVLTPMSLELRDTAVCVGETLKLDVMKTIPDSVSYKWHTGETTPQYQSSKSENISVTIQYSNQCFLNKSIKFTVITPDYQPIARDTLLCIGTPITFTAGAGLKGETIRWQNGVKERNLTTTTEGVFTAQIDSRCARWVDSFRLQTRDCGNGLYVPNAFSPNDDGVNDVFKPFLKSDFVPIESYYFAVFNRWGNLIFKTTNIEDAWDGNWQNKKAPNEMYIWIVDIRYKYNNKSRKLQKSGDILLMR
jgi:gliding motility-associated-like protein